jgi:SpoU rRNA methylase family enzyme
LIQHFHEEVYGFKVRKFVVVRIYACAEEEPSIPAVDDLRGAAELDKVGLMFLVTRGDKAVDLTLELDLLVVVVGAVPFR